MTGSRITGLALAALLACALGTGAARAQVTVPAAPAASDAAAAGQGADAAVKKTKPVKRKIAKSKAKPTVSVLVVNLRAVGLAELDAAYSGSGDSVRIAGPLAAGKKVVVKVEHDKACLFDLHGVYDDTTTTDVSGVELCKDKKINLVE